MRRFMIVTAVSRLMALAMVVAATPAGPSDAITVESGSATVGFPITQPWFASAEEPVIPEAQ